MSPKVAIPATILFVGLCFAALVTFAKADEIKPQPQAPVCVPYDAAMAILAQSGARVLGEVNPGFAKGRLMFFEFEGAVYAAGVAIIGDKDFCVYSPSTAVGKFQVPGTPA